MKPSMLSKLDQLANRLVELDELLMTEGVTANMDSYRKMTREHAELSPLVAVYRQYESALANTAEAQELLQDPEMKDFAQEEIEAAKVRMAELEQELQKMLLPKDANDERNIFLEIRAGTGGDESALFAGDLLRMYTRFAERNRWQVEMVSESTSDLGGYREVIVRIVGNGAYSKLKFESGGHRVQRVPATETQGRIHTSACTVAVMPEADEVEDIDINPADLRIDTYRASGAGGQHINKTDSAVRITHLPTGLVVECQDDRDVGGAAADVDQHHAQFLFVDRQDRVGGRHRLQDQVRNLETAAAHALYNVLHGGDRTGDNVHPHFEADAAHGDRLAHVFLVVDDEFLRHRVQQLLVGRDVHRLGRLDHARHVGRRDFLLLDRHHPARIERTDMAAGDARVDVADLAIRHQLGLFQRALDRFDGGLDVDDHAFLQSPGLVLTQPDHLVASVEHHFGDHGHHLGGADVETDDQVFRVFCHCCSLLRFAWLLYWFLCSVRLWVSWLP